MKRFLSTVILLFLFSLGCGASNDTETGKVSHNQTPTVTETPSSSSDELKLQFLNNGDGGIILLDLANTEILICKMHDLRSVTAYIQPFVDGSLDAVISANPYVENIAELTDIIKDFDVPTVWFCGELDTSEENTEFISNLTVNGSELRIAKSLDDITVADFSFRVLHPAVSRDDSSAILYLKYGQIDFLFTGDANQETIANMNTEGILPEVEFLELDCDSFSIPLSSSFLQATDPTAIIFTGAKSDLSVCPDDTITSELEALGYHIRSTSTDGTVIISTDGVGYSVECSDRPGTLLSVNPA